jgi:hypothetical protein
MNFRRSLPGLFLIAMLLSSCSASKGTTNAPASDNAAQVSGARDATMLTLTVLERSASVLRPAPLLSIYVNMLLADGLAVPVEAARSGIEAQLLLHAPLTGESIDSLYALLEEFAAVLHVDVNDLLNRSDNRIETLDAYSVGLRNITERSRRRAEEVQQDVATLKTQTTEQKKTVSALGAELKNATKAKDFATAQEKQSALGEAQAQLTATQSQLNEMLNIQAILSDLLKIAGQRIAALESNREILIAGLKVVDVPGVEDLGVLQGRTGGSRRGGFSPFGGL